MKCKKCGDYINLGDNYYNDEGDCYCINCIEEEFTQDQIIMMYAGFDIEREEDIQEYKEICDKFPNRNVLEDSDYDNFNKIMDARSEEYDSHFYCTTFEDPDEDPDYIKFKEELDEHNKNFRNYYNTPFSFKEVKNEIVVDELGTVQLFDTLVEYERPLIFVCNNKDVPNRMYLFSEFEQTEEFEQWIAIEISSERYDLLTSSAISLQDAFRKPEQPEYLKITHTFNDNKFEVETLKKLPFDTVTKYDIFLKDLRNTK